MLGGRLVRLLWARLSTSIFENESNMSGSLVILLPDNERSTRFWLFAKVIGSELSNVLWILIYRSEVRLPIVSGSLRMGLW